jgi:tetratricopeptide (TPR) repeat protein
MSHEAEIEFNKALILDPTIPNANYFWAITILQGNGTNPTPEVYSHLHAELLLNPRHFAANYMLGSLASTARNDAVSDRYLHLASEINPSVPETWVLLGSNAQRRKSNQAAMSYFRKAIERGKNLDPKEHFELRKAYFGLGRLLVASGKTKEGEESLAKAKELQVLMLAENRNKFAATKEVVEKDGMGADAPYIPEVGSIRHPYLPLSSAKPATATEKSHTKPREATHPRPDPQGKEEAYLTEVLGASFNDLATAEALESKYGDALAHYREAAQWDPKIPGLQRNLGLAAYFAGQPAEAIRLLSNTMAQAPGDSHARAVLGLAYFSTGSFAKTVLTLTPIAEQTLQDPELGLAWATSLNQTSNKRAASRALDRLETSGKLLEAIEQFERTAQAQPSNLSYHLGLEEAYRKVGRVADADQQRAIYESLISGHAGAPSSVRRKNQGQ